MDSNEAKTMLLDRDQSCFVLRRIISMILKGGKEKETIWLSIDIATLAAATGLRRRKELTKMMELLLEILREGDKTHDLILIPTFNYEFAKSGFFDVKNSNSAIGAFGNFLIQSAPERRSLNPIYSFIAFGRKADEFIKRNIANTVGENSIFKLLHDGSTWLITVGHYYTKSLSSIHQIEYEMKVNYRKEIIFEGKVNDINNRKYNVESRFYGRKYDMCDFSGLTKAGDIWMHDKGLVSHKVHQGLQWPIASYSLELSKAAKQICQSGKLFPMLVGATKAGEQLEDKQRPIQPEIANELYQRDIKKFEAQLIEEDKSI